MAITISGENNNDKILAQDGVIDQISGINIVGLITSSHINVGSNIQLGNAGIITATTFNGNLTGNVNSTSPLLLQTGGSERFRITGNNELGIAGANYGTSGQVLTSGGSGSAVSWTTPVTINNNADNRVITGTGSANVLNAESNVHVDGSGRLLVGTSTNNAHANADNAVISGTGNIGLSIMSTDSGRSSIYFGDSSSSPGSYAGFIDFIHSSNSFNIGRGNDNSLTIDSSGRLLIGTTTEGHPAGDNLTVADSGHAGITIRSGTTSNGALYFSDGTSGADEYRGGVVYHHDGNYMRFYTNGTERVRFDSSGRVMIGTSTEGHASADDLTIYNSGNGGITIRTGTTSNGAIFFSDATSGAAEYDGWVQYNHGTAPYMIFGTAGNTRLRIDSSGHMGLGVTPSAWPTNNDYKGLQVGSGACIFGRGSGDEDRGGIAVNYYGTTSGAKYITNGHGSRIYMADGNIYLQNAASNSSGAGAAMTLYTRLLVNQTGRLKINHTQTPGQLDDTWLSIYDANSDSSANDPAGISKNYAMIALHNYGTGSPGDVTGIAFGAASSFAYTKGSIAFERTGSYGTGDLVFLTNNDQDSTLVNNTDEKMRITRDGKVIIGNPNASGTGALTIYPNSITGNGRLDVYGGGDENNQTQARNEVMRIGRGDILDQYYHSIWSATGSGSSNSHFLKFYVSNGNAGATNQKEALSMNGNGYVTKANHPSFCARHQGSDGFSGDIIVLTRISTSWDVWNTGGHYSTSTGKFTAPVTGVYYFEGQLMTTGHSNGDNIQDMFSLESNHGRITYVRQRESYFSNTTNANGYYTNSCGSSVRLSAGDTVWLQRKSGHSWGYSNRYYSYFTGWLIG